jgi:hypothetical protein
VFEVLQSKLIQASLEVHCNPDRGLCAHAAGCVRTFWPLRSFPRKRESNTRFLDARLRGRDNLTTIRECAHAAPQIGSGTENIIIRVLVGTVNLI